MILKILHLAASSAASTLEPMDEYTQWDSFKSTIWPTVILGVFLLIVFLVVFFSIFFGKKNKKK